MKNYIYFLILLFMFSCVKNYSIYSECDLAGEALDAWQQIEDFEYYFTKRENTSDITIYKKNRTSDFDPHGIYYGNGVIKSENKYRTLAHEIGHFLGYKHSTNSNSMMYGYHILSATNFISLSKKNN